MGRKRQAKQLANQRISQSTSQQPQSAEPQGAAMSAASEADTTAPESRNDVEIILGLPRLARIILVIIPTFAAVVVLQPLIDTIYLRYFFSMETRDAAALVTAAVALVVFLIGWLLVVGNAGETPPVRRSVRVYLYLAIALVLFAVLWLAYLYVTNLRLQI